jgi:DHA1 family tetracycline resistance protein-like MFS transporter
MKNRPLISIFLVVFIDLLGFSFILPLLPYFAATFGASPFAVGLLTASYAAAQFLGAPLLGRLSDRYGRRPILLLSIVGTFLGFILLGLANTLWLLFVSRILDGLTGGNISIAQAYISDVTDEKNRAKGLGMIGAAFGLGFIIGPAMGGFLSQYSYSLPAFVAAGLSFANLLLVAFWLPESLTRERRAALAAGPARPPFTFQAMLRALRRPVVGPLLHTRFFFGLAFSLFQTVFALYAQYRFNLTARDTAFILTYVGVLSVFTQGFLIGRLTRHFTEQQLIFACTATMAVSLLSWAWAPSIVLLLVILLPTSISGGILNTVINSAATKSVSPMEIGGILGLSSALESLTRVIAPSIGGLLLERLGTGAPGVFGFAILALLTSYIWRTIYSNEAAAVVTPPLAPDPIHIDR